MVLHSGEFQSSLQALMQFCQHQHCRLALSAGHPQDPLRFCELGWQEGPAQKGSRKGCGVRRRFYNNIASNCADPSRADYYPQWCDDFQALCKRFRNSTGAAKAAIREEGTTFLGAPMDVPCQTWNGAPPSILEPR